MHADLSRSTFRPERHYSAVLAQQGRVQLDADANEQAAIQLHRARTTAADLIGPHGGPVGANGFQVSYDSRGQDIDDLRIAGGRYYVDGVLVDATRPAPGTPVPDSEDAEPRDAAETSAQEPPHWTYWDQPDGHLNPEHPGDRLPDFPFVAYLKVWERTVTAAEDPELREVALGSAAGDTAARVKTVWQVLAVTGSELGASGNQKEAIRKAFATWAEKRHADPARLAARAQRPEHADEDPCLVTPDARYRGPENQLYRVEVHDGGSAGEATFKWSRENGSVVFPVDELDGTWVRLASVGGDDKLSLNPGDRVEFGDSAYTSRLRAMPLLRVEEVDLPERRVRLSAEPPAAIGRRPELQPYLRRWDHTQGNRRADGGRGQLRNGAVPVEEGRWLALENGVEIYLEAAGGTYRTGDYWCVPARTATGDVEWPTDRARRPLLRDPSGITVRYAPLAWVRGESSLTDLRLEFAPSATG